MGKLLCLFLVIGSIYWGVGDVAAKQVSHAPVIALTFDDGPDPTYTPQVLQVLEHYGVKATFFCIGQQVQRYPDVVRKVFHAGNVVGNHSWNHPVLTSLSSDAIREQLQETSLAIHQAIGVSPLFFRPPYEATNDNVRHVVAQLGMRESLYTIDPLDWKRPGVNAIVNVILSHAKNGSIVLMHDGGGNRSQTVQALSLVILGLRQRGFTFTTISYQSKSYITP